MDDKPKTEEENWLVEPPKDGGSKKRKALRVALIVAVLAAAVAAGIVFYGGAIRDNFRTMKRATERPMTTLGILVPNPPSMECGEIGNGEYCKEEL